MTTVPHPTDVRKPTPAEAGRTARDELESCAPQRLGELLRDYLHSWTEDFESRLETLLTTTHDAGEARQLLLDALSELEAAAKTSAAQIHHIGREPGRPGSTGKELLASSTPQLLAVRLRDYLQVWTERFDSTPATAHRRSAVRRVLLDGLRALESSAKASASEIACRYPE